MAARHFARMSIIGAALLLCGTLVGCVTLDPFTKNHDAPPTGQVTQIAVTWDKAIAFVPDFAHGGAMMPGLMCRIYLFGTDAGVPLAGDGTVSVDLFDDTPLCAGGKSTLKERWNLDKDTFRGCMRKDLVGWGYTLFLPLATYSQSIKQVHMMVRYTPANGIPFYSPSQTMALIHPDGGPSGLAQNRTPSNNLAAQPASPTQTTGRPRQQPG